MKRTWIVAIAATLFPALAQAGPVSTLKTTRLGPDLEAIVVCPAEHCGLDATCARVMSIEDIHVVRRQSVDMVQPLTLVAAGPLSDRLWVAGDPGQLVRANGKGGRGEFYARELFLPTSNIDQELVREAMRLAATICSVSDGGQVTSAEAVLAPSADIDSAPDAHLLPVLTAANEAIRRARSALVEAMRYPACPKEVAEQALQAIDEYQANNPIRRSD